MNTKKLVKKVNKHDDDIVKVREQLEHIEQQKLNKTDKINLTNLNDDIIKTLNGLASGSTILNIGNGLEYGSDYSGSITASAEQKYICNTELLDVRLGDIQILTNISSRVLLYCYDENKQGVGLVNWKNYNNGDVLSFLNNTAFIRISIGYRDGATLFNGEETIKIIQSTSLRYTFENKSVTIEKLADDVFKTLDSSYVNKKEQYIKDSINVNAKLKKGLSGNKHLFIMFDVNNLLNKLDGSEKFNIELNVNINMNCDIAFNIFNNNDSNLDNYSGGDIYGNIYTSSLTANNTSSIIINNKGGLTNYRYAKIGIKFNITDTSKALEIILDNIKIKLGDYDLTEYLIKADILDATNNRESIEYNINEIEKYATKIDIEDLKSNVNATTIDLSNFKLPKYKILDAGYGLVGRWFKNSWGDYVTINAGAEIHFMIKGATSISMKLSGGNRSKYIAYQIDGGDIIRLQIPPLTETTVLLQDNLTTNKHYIRVIVDSLNYGTNLWEKEEGFILKDFIVDSGTITGVYPLNRKILFFGDSITAGVNNLGADASQDSQSAYQSYSFICSEKLNSTNIRVGFPSTGVNIGGLGKVPQFSGYISNISSSREQDIGDIDLIIINHGTNGNSATSSEFKTQYLQDLNSITIEYPGVPIICVIPFLGRRKAEITECVNITPNCYLIDTSDYGVTNSDELHPDVQGSIVGGEKLADEIIKILGKDYFLI